MAIKKYGSAIFALILVSGMIRAEAKDTIQEEFTLSGRTEPYQQVIVSPEMEGKLKSIEKDIGVYVKKGERLAELYEGNLPELVKQAEDQIKIVEAQGNLTAMEHQIALNQTMATINQAITESKTIAPEVPILPVMSGFPELEAAKVAVKDAELALAEVTKEWEETKQLFENDYVPQKELEQLTSAKTKAELELKTAQEKVVTETEKIEVQKQYEKEVEKYEKEKAKYDQVMKSASQQTRGSAQDTIKLQKQSAAVTSKMTQIAIENAKSELEAIKSQYEELSIIAPVHGFITEKNGRIGEVVSPGNTLFVLTDLDQLYITVNVPEAMVNRWQKDQVVSINFPTQNIMKEGKVVYVSLIPNREDNTYPVKIIVDNQNHAILAGMQAVVTLITENENNQASTPETKQEG